MVLLRQNFLMNPLLFGKLGGYDERYAKKEWETEGAEKNA